MGFFDGWDASDWVDLAKVVGGGLSAKKASDQAMDLGDLKDLWLYQNSAQNNPYFNSRTVEDGQGGTRQDTQFSPAIQAMFDSFVGSTQGGPRTYNNTLGDLGGASADYQRSRHGLPSRGIDTGYSSTGAPGATGSYGGSDYANDVPDYGDGATAGDSQTGGLSGQDGAGDTVAGTGRPAGPGGAMFDAGFDPRFTQNPQGPGSPQNFDPFNGDLDWFTGDQRSNSGIPYSDRYGGFGGDGQDQQFDWANFMESIMKGGINSGANQIFPGLGYATDQITQDQNWWGQQQGMMAPGSEDFVPPGEASTWDQPAPQRGDMPFNYRQPSIGEYGNSIDRGYGYATRLRPRSTDPQLIPFRSIDEDKIG